MSEVPVANSMEPDANSMEPDANSMEPDANSMEPVANSMEPDANSMESVANSMEPVENPDEMPLDDSKTIKKSDVKNPIFQVPFKYGWVREFRYRKIVGSRSKLVDIYYHIPNLNKKLRSLVQVKNYLAKTNDEHLTQLNFTFCNGLVHPDDESKEIVVGKLADIVIKPAKPAKIKVKNTTPKSKPTTNNETMADNDSRVVLRRNNRKGNGSEQANEIPTTRNTTEKVDKLSFDLLDKMTVLTELRLDGLNLQIDTERPISLRRLIHLKTFTLTCVKNIRPGFHEILITLTTGLQNLEIGDCDVFDKFLTKVIGRLVNLKMLRLENLIKDSTVYSLNVFGVIAGLKKLSVLELININFDSAVGMKLVKCRSLQTLVIIPVYERSAGIVNREIIDYLMSLTTDKVLLNRVFWGIPCELIIGKDTAFKNLYFKQRRDDDIPLFKRHIITSDDETNMNSIEIISVLVAVMLDFGIVLKVNSKETIRVRSEDIFNN